MRTAARRSGLLLANQRSLQDRQNWESIIWKLSINIIIKVPCSACALRKEPALFGTPVSPLLPLLLVLLLQYERRKRSLSHLALSAQYAGSHPAMQEGGKG